jgi:hypothetical protein
MNRLIFGSVVLLLTSAAAISYGQSEQYRLSPGEYAVAVGLGFLEDATLLDSSLIYGISQNLVGSLVVGLGFVEEDPIVPGVSIPPVPMFAVGFGTVDALGQTGLDYCARVDFGVDFGKFVEDATDRTIMTLRAAVTGLGFGFAKEIATGSDLVIVPSAGISYSYTWTTLESRIVDFTETESDADWGGQIGLTVRISPKMSVAGAVGFSFEESDIVYSISMLFRPL